MPYNDGIGTVLKENLLQLSIFNSSVWQGITKTMCSRFGTLKIRKK